MTVSAVALAGLPEVSAGDDLAAMVVAAGEPVGDGDVVCVAHKVVSKAEGRVRLLGDVDPGERARELAARLDRDPRHVQVVLDEAAEVIRDERVLICRARHGFVCANAGVDASNVGEEDTVTLLPEDPDASARGIRDRVMAEFGVPIAVIVSDSFGRPWRWGIVDVALGVAGFGPLDDLRGQPDADGRVMHATVVAVADEIASAAELASGKTSGRPLVLVRGASLPPGNGSIAQDVVMPLEADLFP